LSHKEKVENGVTTLMYLYGAESKEEIGSWKEYQHKS
jgi:hypothetical protein